MEEAKGKISLAGFDIDIAEKAIVDSMLKNYNHKMIEKGGYDYIQIRLKKSQKGKTTLYEVKGNLKSNSGILTSKATDYNLFLALSDVMEKLLNEMDHKLRTSRQEK